MSELSNVTELADFQKRRGAVEPPATRDPNAILADLQALAEEPDLDEVQSLAEELARTLEGSNPLTVELRREAFIRAVGGKVQAPARIFEAARRSVLDRNDPQSGSQGRALRGENPAPWPDPVDGAMLLDQVQEIFNRYLVLGEGAAVILSLWSLHTFAVGASWISPRLAVTSPEKRCGKSRVLTILSRLVAKPLPAVNATSAAIFRSIESKQPTLLIDEADTFLDGKEELRGVLNSGHEKEGQVLRVVGDDHEPRAFATFAPVAIAKIGALPDTLADRSIDIRMRRKTSGERVERLRLDRLDDLENLRCQSVRWTDDHFERLAQADPDVPEKLHDRAADNWRPLLAIADEVGGDWPRAARSAAEFAVESGTDSDTSLQALLLADVRDLFDIGGVEAFFSSDLVGVLVALEDRPWAELRRGRPLTTHQTARLLRPYGITPKQIRIGDETRKGYRLDAFLDAFARYLPPSNRNNRNNPLGSTTCAESRTETQRGGVSLAQAPETPDPMGVVSDVSVCEPTTGRDASRETMEL